MQERPGLRQAPHAGDPRDPTGAQLSPRPTENAVRALAAFGRLRRPAIMCARLLDISFRTRIHRNGRDLQYRLRSSDAPGANSHIAREHERFTQGVVAVAVTRDASFRRELSSERR